MKIAFITQPWDGIGPGSSLGILTCNIIKRLSKDNEIIVFAKNGKCDLSDNNNVKYNYHNYKFDKIFEKIIRAIEKTNIFHRTTHPYFSSVFYYLLYSLNISLQLKKEKIQIVHIHNFSQFIPMIKIFNPGIKIILHMHCEWLTQISVKLIRSRIQKADIIIGCSNYISNKIKERFPESAKKIVTVHNATDLDEKGNYEELSNTGNRILFVGRISPEKGVHTLIEAFNQIAETIPDCQLDLVGAIKSVPRDFIVGMDANTHVKELLKFYNSESYFSQLKKLISKSASSRVNFYGHIDHIKLAELYKNADVVANPSLSESFGMAVIEANSFGVPVVVTNTGGMAELVEDGKNGYKITPADAGKLAEKIILILKNKALKELMGKYGQYLVEKKYNWDFITKKIRNIYLSLLSE